MPHSLLRGQNTVHERKNWKDASGFKILEQFLGEIEGQIKNTPGHQKHTS